MGFPRTCISHPSSPFCLYGSDGLLNLVITKFPSDIERHKPIRFSYLQLKQANNNFSRLLGSGGFGAIYKGVFADGTPVAVKVLSGNSDRTIREQFMAEVSTVGRIHHFNLVQLYGFCFERGLRALVYEFMDNCSLDNHLFLEKTTLEPENLHEIAVGIANGIAYLHEECRQRIIHYDIKPGNILMDSRFTPKVADFGLAKLHNREKTHMTLNGGYRPYTVLNSKSNNLRDNNVREKGARRINHTVFKDNSPCIGVFPKIQLSPRNEVETGIVEKEKRSRETRKLREAARATI